ncbi:MAG: L,D-transpeptidase family protein, partial [Pseudolabrys sp.]
MRKTHFNFLSGTMLALVVAPALSIAAPERVEIAVPLPPAVNALPIQPPEAQPASAATPNSDSGLNLKGTVDQVALGDAEIRDKLRVIVMDKQLELRIDRAAERQAVESFYVAHDYAPLWSSDGRLNALAKSVIARLKNASADGLDPTDYPVPDFAAAKGAEALADADIRLTNSMLTFARHLATGRVAPSRVLAEVDYGSHAPDPADILRKITETGDAGAALESYNPAHEG